MTIDMEEVRQLLTHTARPLHQAPGAPCVVFEGSFEEDGDEDYVAEFDRSIDARFFVAAPGLVGGLLDENQRLRDELANTQAEVARAWTHHANALARAVQAEVDLAKRTELLDAEIKRRSAAVAALGRPE